MSVEADYARVSLLKKRPIGRNEEVALTEVERVEDLGLYSIDAVAKLRRKQLQEVS